MSASDLVPADPAGQEPLEELFGTVFSLAGEAVSRIGPAEVEVRLRRVLQEAARGSGEPSASGVLPRAGQPADAEPMAAPGLAPHLQQPGSDHVRRPVSYLATAEILPVSDSKGPDGGTSGNVEVVPVVTLSQTFPARKSSVPGVIDFVKRCLAQSPLPEEDNREVAETVIRALLEAVAPAGAISVAFRIFPDHVEVDVLRSGAQTGTAGNLGTLGSLLGFQAADTEITATGWDKEAGNAPDKLTFTDWMAGALRSENMTIELTSSHIGVSVKAVSR